MSQTNKYLVEADVDKPCVEVGCRLMCIGNGWENLQSMKLSEPVVMHRECDCGAV